MSSAACTSAQDNLQTLHSMVCAFALCWSAATIDLSIQLYLWHTLQTKREEWIDATMYLQVCFACCAR
jgi:hypothetical protein